jgi:hypothetical protein
MIKAPVPCQISGEKEQVTFKLRNISGNHYQELKLTTSPAYSLRRAKMALQPLPTRDEFIATGLEPVEQDQCVICFKSPRNEPVQVNCNGKHEFCRDCILQWFDEHNTCPMCRQQLFAHDYVDLVDLDEEAREARLQRRLRRIQVERAFDDLGLEGCLIGNPPLSGLVHVIRVHNDIRWSNGRIIRSSLAARDWLVYERDLLEDGGQTINVEDLGSSLIVMGNLLKEISLNSDALSPLWTHVNRQTWREIIFDIWQFMAQYRSTHMHLSSLYRSLVASLIDKYYIGVAQPCPFFQEGPLLNSLRVLINFTIFKSGQFVTWAGPLNRRPRPGTKIPRVFASTASDEAIWRAAQWTEDAFE